MKNILNPKFLIQTSVIVSLTLLSACASSIIVHKDGEDTNLSKKVKGIPFYVQKEIINQETKYLYSWYEVTLIEEIISDAKTKTSILITTKMKKELKSLIPINKLLDSLSNSPANLITLLGDTKDKINALPKPIFPPNTPLVELVSNNWKSEVMVDYNTKYYLNSKMPWFGSATLAQKQAPNGTLTETLSTSDSQLDELAGSLASIAIPYASIKVAKIESDAVQDPLAAISADARKVYKLKVQELGYLYTFSKIICDGDCKSNYDTIKSLDFDLESGNYKRSNWTPSVAKPKPEDDKPTINISGSIQLPSEKKE